MCPKETDIHKIMVIGSGPIVIGQAAEFDYAGTQACLALKEEGYEVVLVNSNPATIMTDTTIADKVYMEPLTLEYIAKIIRYERPDAILPGIGGQTGLNLAMQLEKKGVLKECQVELLGTPKSAPSRGGGPGEVQGTVRAPGRARTALGDHAFHRRRRGRGQEDRLSGGAKPGLYARRHGRRLRGMRRSCRDIGGTP